MSGMANEFGHITVEPAGTRCGCGNRGCLEAYASATAVVRMAQEAIGSGAAPGLARAAQANGDFSAKADLQLGDRRRRTGWANLPHGGKELGIALSDLVNALNLPIYVVGGGVSGAWDVFSPAIFKELRQRSMVYAATAPDSPSGNGEGASAHVKPGGSSKTIITRALLGSDAGLYGAARLPMVDA